MHPNYLGWLRISFHTNVATRTTRRYILSFKPSNSTSEEDAMRVMECCIKKIWRWRIQDRLLVNDDKTEFRIIGTRQQFRKLQAINIKVGSSEKKKQQKLSVSKMWWREAVPGMGLGSRWHLPFWESAIVPAIFGEDTVFVSLVYCLWHYNIQSGISDISKGRFYQKTLSCLFLSEFPLKSKRPAVYIKKLFI